MENRGQSAYDEGCRTKNGGQRTEWRTQDNMEDRRQNGGQRIIWRGEDRMENGMEDS
jgi:hypothetical protein